MALSNAQIREILSEAGVDQENMSDAVSKLAEGYKMTVLAKQEEIDSLKAQNAQYKAEAERLLDAKKELDALKANPEEDWKAKYNAEHIAHEKLKSDIASEKARTAKEAAVKAYFESRHITGTGLNLAMRASAAEIAAIELGKDGAIKDTSKLDALVAGDFAGLVSKESTISAQTATPPIGAGVRTQGSTRAAQLYQQHYASLYGAQNVPQGAQKGADF